MTYLVFNVRSDGVIDAVYGLTNQNPNGSPKKKFVAEGKTLPPEFFDGRPITGVTVYVYSETDRQFLPSLFYAPLNRNDGREQFEVRKSSSVSVLDKTLVIR
jgi:hypothetical protein